MPKHVKQRQHGGESLCSHRASRTMEIAVATVRYSLCYLRTPPFPIFNGPFLSEHCIDGVDAQNIPQSMAHRGCRFSQECCALHVYLDSAEVPRQMNLEAEGSFHPLVMDNM